MQIDRVNLQTLDLNLLKVFEALAEERSATRAGTRLGLTQSSVSNALNRLRLVLGDELFVRTPQGMLPTPRAMQLDNPVRAALSRIRTALSETTAFELASVTGTIRISTADFMVASLAKKLLRAITDTAPNVNLRFSQLDKRTVYDDLDNDRLDLAVSAFLNKPRRMVSRLFMQDRYVCLGKLGHPAFDNGLTLERYISYPHILVSFNADSVSAIDTILAERGLSRRVGVAVGNFQHVPDLLAKTDYLATVPAASVATLIELGTCETVRLPLHVPDRPIEMLWSRRADSDPLQSWARGELVELAAT